MKKLFLLTLFLSFWGLLNAQSSFTCFEWQTKNLKYVNQNHENAIIPFFINNCDTSHPELNMLIVTNASGFRSTPTFNPDFGKFIGIKLLTINEYIEQMVFNNAFVIPPF